jgi:hydrocephalus-inducing protein
MIFEPRKPEKIETTLNMVVLDNHFEDAIFKVIAEGYEEDITFDDLPPDQLLSDSVDSINFKHCAVNVKKPVTFTLVNHSENHVKYTWNAIPNITVYPTFGHLHSKSSTEITVTLLAPEPLEYVNQVVKCELQKIQYVDGNIQEWDERHKTIKWIQVDEEEEKRQKEEEERKKQEESDKRKKKRPNSRSSGRLADNKKKKNDDAPPPSDVTITTPPKLVTRRVEIINPEPQIQIVHALPVKPLRVSALADFVQFEHTCPTEVSFKLTKMFESRLFTFTMKNTGKVNMNYDWKGDEDFTNGPYTVTPQTGTLEPQTEETFTIKYAPLDVGDHFTNLYCVIPNSKQEPPLVHVSGTSLCPIVHFELAPSDYLSSGRRTFDSKGPGGTFGALDKNSTKVIEISSCGIRIRNTKRFYILNPTDTSYQYAWKRVPVDNEDIDDNAFNCASKKGVVHSGMKAEMVFEYTPSTLVTMESFWLFSIPSRNIYVPFIFVGHAKEPDLYLDTARISFQQVLVDKAAKKTIRLINREKIPFSFAFDQSSFGGSGTTLGDEYNAAQDSSKQETAVISVTPSHGTIGGEEEIPIVVTFVPSSEHSYNFSLSCNVRKKPTLLTCNVKGEGFKVHERLELDSSGGKTILAPQIANKLEFDRTQINEKKVKRLIIFNDGAYNFDFSWHHANSQYITIEPASGTVEKRGRLSCDIIFNPTVQVNLENYKVVCKITNGQNYVCYINASGTKPKISFSWMQYDFGPCFLFNQGSSPTTAVLEVKNEDDKELSYEIIYDNKPHFEVEATATVLKPKEIKKIPIAFKPKEVKQYREVITFSVNNLYKVPVVLQGEGTGARIELWNPVDKLINFGPLQVGDTVETTIGIVNKSKIPVEITFLQEMHAQMAKNFVTASCKKAVTLQPKAKHNISVFFKPEARLATFSHELVAQVAGRTKVISTITGACQGIEVKLNTPILSFGPIIKGTQIMQKVILENSGDIGVKFNWEVEKMNKEFTIHPLKGFAPANGELAIEVAYAPKPDSRNTQNDKIQCIVEGHQPLVLTLNGACKDKAGEEDHKISFKVPVRQVQKKVIKITNPTKGDWRLRPEIDNPAFSGPEYLDIAGGQSREYEITYAPVRMTVNTESSSPDVGTLFFPRPDGEAYGFNLFGESIEPLSAGDIKLELAAKEQHVQILQVENWLSRAQRFKVQLDLNVKSPDQLKAVDYIDVPPFAKREYKFTYYAYKEGVVQGKIYFRNEQTKEFLFYTIVFNVKPPKHLQVLNFESTIRQKTCQTINIENPLTTETRLAVKCDAKDVLIPTELIIPPASVGKCDIYHFPLLSASSQVTIEEKDIIFFNNELGSFPFKLILKSMPTGPEKNVHFNVGLGNSMTQTIRFTNYSNVATEYTCKLDSSNFTLTDKPVIKVQPGGSDGKEESIDVSYEPSALGDCQDKLTITSKIGGEYVFLLFGHCTPPRPQGPLEIAPNGSAVITFKNVFTKKMDYKFTVDHEAFSVKPETASLTPKQKLQITVSFKGATAVPQNGTSSPSPQNRAANQRIYGKLTVSPNTKDKAILQTIAQTQWIYYLLGKMK